MRTNNRWRPRRAVEPIENETQHYASKAAINAAIGLLVTLIGTGVLSMFTLYVKVATLTDTVQLIAETQKKHLADAVSERQYQKDQVMIYDTIHSLATKQEVTAVAARLDEQAITLRKIEDAVSSPRRLR
jgi:hypothetical protein